MIRQSDFNPVAQSQKLALGNLVSIARSQFWLSVLLMLLTAGLAWLLFQMILTVIDQHSGLLEHIFHDRAALVWAGLFVLSVGSLMPQAKRQHRESTSGWMAALPQMPQASRSHLACTLGLICLVEAALLLIMLILLERHFHQTLPWPNWLLALAVPIGAALTVGWLVRRTVSEEAIQSNEQTIKAHVRQGSGTVAGILRQWQWAKFRDSFWAPGTRWAIGGLLILIPSGASTMAVAITLLVGWAMIQVVNAWSAWMRVIVEASQVLRTLPSQTVSLIWMLSALPLALIVIMSSLLAFGLNILGASATSAVMVSLLFQALSLLMLAGVLAWRHSASIPQWGISSIVILWVLLSQSMPPLAPLLWLLLMLILIKRSIRP